MREQNGNPEVIAPEVVVFRQEEAQQAVTALALTDDLVAMAEKRLVRFQKLKEVAMRATNQNDFTALGENPYLRASGAEKIGRLFGIKWSGLKVERIGTEDDRGRYYIYVCTGLFELPGGIDSIVSVGTCSQRDAFFSEKTYWEGQGEDRKKTTVFKTTSEIDETNILKSAVSNCIQNGVTRLLGLRGLTWDEVEKAGIVRGKVAKVSYDKPMDKESADKREEIKNMVLEMIAGDVDAAGPLLSKVTTWTNKEGKIIPGKDDPYKISDAALGAAFGQVKKAHEEWKKGQAGKPASPPPPPAASSSGFEGKPTVDDAQGALL